MTSNTETADAGAGPTDPPSCTGPPSATSPPVADSATLLAGGRELVIRHGTGRYRLLLTAQNKLILTK